MAQHTITATDTWPGIATRHGIRYWQNIYLAPENATLRAARGSPDQFRFGDVLHIPDRSLIRPMEKNPRILHRKVPLFTQSELTCWRATGRMLYFFKYPKASPASFNKAIGERYRKLEEGLKFEFWSDFYKRALGMTEKKIAAPNDLHYLLAIRGPVVVSVDEEGGAGHSVLMVGYDILRGEWTALNPAAGESFSFADDVIDVGPSKPSTAEESGPAKAKHTAGRATWKNMAVTYEIWKTTVNQRVFCY